MAREQSQDQDLNIGAQRRLPEFDYASTAIPYFVTICARRPLYPFTDPRLASAAIESLQWLRRNRGVILYAYCLMPDHLHLLLELSDGERPLGEIIRAFKGVTTRAYWAVGGKGALWQDRFYDHILRRSEDARGIAEYIRANPVRRGLVEDPDAYPYSGYPDPMHPRW